MLWETLNLEKLSIVLKDKCVFAYMAAANILQ